MKIIIEEFNVIMAALRRTEMAHAVGGDRAARENRHSHAARARNTSAQCKMLADEWQKRGAGSMELRETQYRLIINVLLATHEVALGYSRVQRAAFKRVEADQQEAFAVACKDIAEKWQREGFHPGSIGLLH